jgi:hypothetical protein
MLVLRGSDMFESDDNMLESRNLGHSHNQSRVQIRHRIEFEISKF